LNLKAKKLLNIIPGNYIVHIIYLLNELGEGLTDARGPDLPAGPTCTASLSSCFQRGLQPEFDVRAGQLCPGTFRSWFFHGHCDENNASLAKIEAGLCNPASV